MNENCFLCRIAAHNIAAHDLYEDRDIIAFLDIFPIRPGHALIIPKQHFPYFDNTPADLVTSIVLLGQKLARVMKQVYRVPRTCFLFTGGDEPHVHAHLVPMHEKTDITSRRYIAEEELTFRDMPRAPDGELRDTAALLGSALRMGG